MQRFRRVHLILLGAALIAVIALVWSRGFTGRGLTLIGVTALLFAARLWQFRRSRRTF